MTGSWLAGLAGAGLGRPRAGATGMVFAIVIGSILQVLLMSLLSLGLQLEDPFDTGPAAAPDTVSLLEFNHTLSYLTAPADAEDDLPAAEDAEQEQQRPANLKYQQDIQGFAAQQHEQQQQQHGCPAAAAPAAALHNAVADPAGAGTAQQLPEPRLAAAEPAGTWGAGIPPSASAGQHAPAAEAPSASGLGPTASSAMSAAAAAAASTTAIRQSTPGDQSKVRQRASPSLGGSRAASQQQQQRVPAGLTEVHVAVEG
ncbi:hypothetical protein COO60DRAFT_421587 [Scenedesmus sp. NREL 46B-D3]|nr:hypothetical protein COO60DRAFT_421587 [Scenedesmus sp. NREL 46B-D3]